jgi:hypothetical protein
VTAAFLFWLLQVATPGVSTAPTAAAPRAQQQFPLQLGVRVTPDTVTVGQRFIVLIRVRAPAAATIQFPTGVDSSVAVTATAPQVIGAPVFDSLLDATGTTRSAAYAFTAWDVGAQRLGLGKIAVTVNGRTEYVSLASQQVFVRSVLPIDTTQRVPKPLRPAIILTPFNWWPWLALLAAILLALLAWWLWRAYRRRKSAPLPPFEAAEREFGRIEAMHLIEGGEAERHAALMADVLRVYLASRVEGVHRSQTSAELLVASASVHPYAPGLSHLLAQVDLVKFARQRMTQEDAKALGTQARAIVRQVENHFTELERTKTEARAA